MVRAQIRTDAARRLLVMAHEYVAPDLLFSETANTIWKKIRRKELTAEEGHKLVVDILKIAVETVSCRALAEDAHALANATGRTGTTRCTLPWPFDGTRARSPCMTDLKLGCEEYSGSGGYIQLVQTFERDVQSGQ